MSDMTYGQAIDLAHNLKNHYAAFEKLEELLGMAANAEGYVRALEDNLATLRHQVADAEAQATASQAQAAEAAQAHRQQLDQQHEEAASAASALQAKYQALGEQLDAEHQRRTADRESDIAALTAKRDELATAVAAKRDELAAVQQAVEQARSFLRGLQTAAG